jgi:hypothetical protein
LARKQLQKQRDRIEEIMNLKLIQIALGDNCIAEASGPQYVPVEGQGVQLGWQLTVFLGHNKLIGLPPVGQTLPVGGVHLTDDFLEIAAVRLLEGARQVRQEMTQKASEPVLATPDTNEMAEVIRRHASQGPNGVGPPT